MYLVAHYFDGWNKLFMFSDCRCFTHDYEPLVHVHVELKIYCTFSFIFKVFTNCSCCKLVKSLKYALKFWPRAFTGTYECDQFRSEYRKCNNFG